jgi:hypothetical protein
MGVGQTTLSVLLMVQWIFFGKNNVAQHVNLVFLTVLMALQARSKISYLKVMIWRFTIKFSIQHCVLAFSAWQVSFQILPNFSLSLSLMNKLWKYCDLCMALCCHWIILIWSFVFINGEKSLDGLSMWTFFHLFLQFDSILIVQLGSGL